MKHIRRRAHLARDIAIILTVKLVALAAIKVIWFADAPAPTATQMKQTLFGPPER